MKGMPEKSGQQHTPAYGPDRALQIQLPHGPDECGYRKDGIYEYAAVVWHVQGVDAEQLEILCYLDESRHEAIEDEADHDSRHTECDERAGRG